MARAQPGGAGRGVPVTCGSTGCTSSGTAALLVPIGGLADGRKVLIALRSGYRESTESWNGVLRDSRQRGLRCPRLVIGDGAPPDLGGAQGSVPVYLRWRA